MSAVVDMVTFRTGSDELDTVVVMAMPVFWQKINGTGTHACGCAV